MSSYNSPSIQSAENSTSLPSKRVSPSVQLFENTYFLLGLLAVTILLTSLYFLLSYCPVTNNIDKLLKTNISKTCRNSFFSLKNNKNQLTSDKQGRSSNNEELYKKEIGIVDSSGTLTVKAINPNNTLIIGKNTLYINPMEGKVGVNTSELISTLTVNGDLSINGLSGEGIRMVVVDENGTLSTKELNNEEIIELTNTNAQYLSLVGDKLTLSEGNTVTLPDKQILSLDGNRLTISGGNSVDLPGVAIQKDNWGEQYVLTDNTIDGKGLGYSRLTIARQGATTGQVLKWNGSTWAPASDEGGTGGGSGTVVSIATGAGLTGGTITTSGTVSLNTSAIASCTANNQKLLWDSSNNRLTCGVDVDTDTDTNNYLTSVTSSGTSTKTLTFARNGLGNLTVNFADIGFDNPMTTAGDLLYGGSSGTPTRLAGSSNDGYVLKYNTSTNAPYWAADIDTNSGGTVTSVSAGTGLSGSTITTTGSLHLDTTSIATCTGSTQNIVWDSVNNRLTCSTDDAGVGGDNWGTQVVMVGTGLTGDGTSGNVLSVNMGDFDTDDLSEGITNQYFTNERVDDRVAALVQDGSGISWSYDDVLGTFTGTVSLTTTSVPEGTNLYYTDARARSAISVSSPLTYNSSTGVLGITQASGSTDGYLSSIDWNTFNSKQSALTFSTGLSESSGIVTATLGTSIETSEITDGTVTFADWSGNSCGTNAIPKYNGTSWVCGSDDNSGGTVTGSGTATQIAFWSSTSALSSSSNLYWDNTNTRLGIGTSSPNYSLEVNGSAPTFSIYDTIESRGFNFINGGGVGTISYDNLGSIVLDDGGNVTVGADNAAGNVILTTANTARLTVANNGYVGIGDLATSPLAPLYFFHAQAATTAGNSYGAWMIPGLAGSLSGGAHTTFKGMELAPVINLTGSTPTVTNAYGSYINGTLQAGTVTNWYGQYIAGMTTVGGSITNKYALVTSSSAGNVGIGTITPSYRLDVSESAVGPALRVANSGAGFSALFTGGVGIGTSTTTNPGASLGVSGGATIGSGYYGAPAPSNGMLVEGNVGIGNTTVGSKLLVKGTGTTSSTSSLNITNSSDSSLFFVRDDGNIGVGTSSPSTKFVLTDAATTTTSSFNNSNVAGRSLLLAQNTATGTSIDLRAYGASYSETLFDNAMGSDVALVGSPGTGNNMIIGNFSNGNLLFGTNNAERLRIDSSGNIGIGVTSVGAKLHVSGNTLLAGDIALGNTSGLDGYGDTGSMIANGGFEVNPNGDVTADGWTNTNSGVNYAEHFTGSSAAQGNGYMLFYNDGGASGAPSTLSACIPVSGGKTYNLYAQARDGGAQTTNLELRVYPYTTKTDCINNTYIGYYYSAFNSDPGGTTAYSTVGGTLGAFGATEKWARVEIIATIDNLETIYVDSVRFTQSTLATAADYMEMYPVDKDSTMGDIVIPTSLLITTKDGDKIARLTKSTQPYQKSVIGIVSDKTKAGETNSIGHNIDAVDNPQPIALAGRVPVKISSASSDIAPGDFITTSAELGKGMKAVKAGHMVGVALEPWLASEGKATVMVYVTNTYADPQDISSKFAVNENGEVIIPEYDTAISGIKDNVATQSGQLASLNSNVLGLNTTAASQAAELISLSEKIASMSSQLQNVDNEHDLTVTELTGIKADLEYLKMSGGSASSSGSLATAEDAQFSTLTVTDKTNVFDLGVTGTITAGIMTLDGVTGEINTLSDAIKLQPMGLGTVDIMGGKVDIDKKGNVAINSGHIKGNDSFRGKAMLKSGTNEIRVEKEWESMPFTVNVTSTYNTKIWVENIDTTGFTIKVDTTTSSDKEIHWIAVW